MKIFANKKFRRRLVITFLIVYLLTAIFPTIVQATENAMETYGGSLLEPIFKLLVGLGDGIISIMHRLLIGQNQSRLVFGFGDLGTFIGVIAAIALVTVAVAITIASGGLMALLSKTLVVGAVIILTGTSGAAATLVNELFTAQLEDSQLVLPIYNLSPEEIFKGKKMAEKNGGLAIFNVNFWDPDINPYTTVNTPKKASTAFEKTDLYPIEDDTTIGMFISGASSLHLAQTLTEEIGSYLVAVYIYNDGETKFYVIERYEGTKSQWNSETTKGLGDKFAYNFYYSTEMLSDVQTILKSAGINNIAQMEDLTEKMQNTEAKKMGAKYQMKIKEMYELKNGNSQSQESNVPVGDTVSTYSFAYLLRNTVITWYKRIRLIAIIGMMSVLVYIGIRMVLSATASDKAKYKQMIGDWLMGMLLLFSMHYIMMFANVFVDNLTEMLSDINPGFYSFRVYFDGKNNSVLIQQLNESGYKLTSDANLVETDSSYVLTDDETNPTYFYWHTNLMGYLRMQVNNAYGEGEGYIGYTILFLTLVVYTIVYVYMYIKRVVYMAFLTMIAPLVALTYPIDKVNDGKAQGFDMWVKEYIFNLLVQPLHLLLYTILISSAIKLSLASPIYAMVAMGFMMPAEKLLRQMFNFSKASTPGLFEGATGAAMTMSMVRWLTGHGPNGGKKSGLPGGENKGSGASGIPSTNEKAVNFSNIVDNNVNGADLIDAPDNGGDATRSNGSTPVGPVGPDSTNTPANDSGNFDSGLLSAVSNDPTGIHYNSDDDLDTPVQDADDGQSDDNNFGLLSAVSNDPTGIHYNSDDDLDTPVQDADDGQSDDNNFGLLSAVSNDPTGIHFNSDDDLDTPAQDADDGQSSAASLQTGVPRNVQQRNTSQRTTSQRTTPQRTTPQRTTPQRISSPISNQRKKMKDLYTEGEKKGFKYYGKVVAGNIGSNLKRGIEKDFTKENLLNAGASLVRGVAGVAGAAALGSLALSGGIASGDPGKVASAVGMGVAGGYKIGGGLADSAIQGTGNLTRGTVDEIQRAHYGVEKYSQMQAEKEQKKQYTDRDNIDYVQKKFKINDRKEAERRTKEIVQFYADNGYEDFKEMVRQEKIVKESIERSGGSMDSANDRRIHRQNMVAGAKLAQTYNITPNMTKEERAAMEKSIRDSHPEWNNAQVKASIRLADSYIYNRSRTSLR